MGLAGGFASRGADGWGGYAGQPMRPARRGGRGGDVLIEGEAWPAADDSEAAYRVGARVFHRKFGYGSVTAAESDRLEIDFDKAGSKKIIASFVVPAERAG